MNTDNSSNEPNVSKMLDPYSNPRTIPGGWDVSAFFTPENDNIETYGDTSQQSKSNTAMTGKHERTKNSL
jgi:hypothetical protein